MIKGASNHELKLYLTEAALRDEKGCSGRFRPAFWALRDELMAALKEKLKAHGTFADAATLMLLLHLQGLAPPLVLEGAYQAFDGKKLTEETEPLALQLMESFEDPTTVRPWFLDLALAGAWQYAKVLDYLKGKRAAVEDPEATLRWVTGFQGLLPDLVLLGMAAAPVRAWHLRREGTPNGLEWFVRPLEGWGYGTHPVLFARRWIETVHARPEGRAQP